MEQTKESISNFEKNTKIRRVQSANFEQIRNKYPNLTNHPRSQSF